VDVVMLCIRINRDLRGKLKKWAVDEHITLRTLIVDILERALNERR